MPSKRPRKCHVCSKVVSNLQNHMRTHTQERPYQCTLCPAKFKRDHHLHRHIQSHTEEKPYKCVKYHARFRRKDHFQNHVKVHPNKKILKCEVCSVRFAKKETLDRHKLQKHSSVKSTDSKINEVIPPVSADLNRPCEAAEAHIQAGVGPSISSSYAEKLRKRYKSIYQSICKKRESRPSARNNLKKQSFSLKSSRNVSKLPEKSLECQLVGESINKVNSSGKGIRKTLQQTNILTTSCLSCIFCGKDLQSKASLHVHLQRHSMETPDFCSICGHESVTVADRMSHIRKFHSAEEKVKPCKRRNYSRPRTGTIKMKVSENKAKSRKGKKLKIKHKSNSNLERRNVKKHECKICNRAFSNKFNMNNHIKFAHSNHRPFQCVWCRKRFKSKYNFIQHSIRHKQERKEFNCVYCGKGFFTRKEYTSHIQSHMSLKRQFTCNICDAGFTKKGLIVHFQLVHKSDTPFCCQMCSEKFKLNEELKKHVKRAHPTEEDPSFWCIFCNKAFQSKGGLEGHLRQHTMEMPYSCGECGGQFANASSWGLHIRIHRNEVKKKSIQKKCKCKSCGKIILDRRNFKRHVQSHLKMNKKHNCFSCNLSFTEKGLIRHFKLVHKSELVHQCKMCRRRFKLKEHVKRHEKRFHGAKSEPCHWCIFCGKGFQTKDGFHIHLLVHVLEKPFFCQVCDIEFPSAAHRNSHKHDGKELRID